MDIFSTVQSSQSPETTQDAFPSYLTAADNHNLGNSGTSWFNIGALGESIYNAPKFVATSVLSGLNSFYNTGVKLGSFLGADVQENKTDAWISSIDSDLGSYYRHNSDSADLVGFLVTSFIPGIGGVKVLNAGQKALQAASSGYVGTNIGRAIGLLTPSTETYIAKAAAEITAGQTAFTALGQNGIKALAAGVGQNVLEGLAFETAIQATMAASPILSSQDKTDIIYNIALGGIFGGAVGGAFEAAKTVGAIRRGVIELGKAPQVAGSRGLIQEVSSPSDRIILNQIDLETGPTINPGSPTYAQEVASLAQRQKRIALDMRTETHNMVVGSDAQLGNMIADTQVGATSENLIQRLYAAKEFGRINSPTQVEKKLLEAARLGEPTENFHVNYWKLTGENAGDVVSNRPAVANLADIVTTTAGRDTKTAVLAKVSDYGFKRNALWDASKISLGNEGHLEAEARYIWAADSMKSIDEYTVVHANDFPVLEKALKEGSLEFQLVNSAGNVLKNSFANRAELNDYIIAAKKDVQIALQKTALKQGKPFEAGKDLAEAQGWVNTKIGKITNTKVSTMEGTSVGTQELDYYAAQTAKAEYQRFLASKGLKQQADEEVDPRFMPTWAKMTRDTTERFNGIDSHVTNAIADITTRQKLGAEAVSRVNAKNLGEFYNQLPEFGQMDLLKTTQYGTGAGAFKFANPGYGSPGSKVAQIGSVVSRASAAKIDEFIKQVESSLYALGQKQAAVIEWGGLNQSTSRSAMRWLPLEVETDTKLRGLVSESLMKRLGKNPITAQEIADAEAETGVKHFIPVRNNETWQVVSDHVAATDAITQAKIERAAAQGKEASIGTGFFRPIPPNPSDYPFFAFVKDPKVTGQGHTSMIFANNQIELNQLVQKAQQARPDLEILFKRDTEEFKAARQSYEYDRTLHENYIDQTLKNNGIYSNYFVKTNPQRVIDEFTQHHTKLINMDVREAIRVQYQAPFDWLEDQAKAFSRVETSRFGGNFTALEQAGKNPYLSYIKTALNISRVNESPLWYSANKVLDESVSKAVGFIRRSLTSADGVYSPKLVESINADLQKYGLNTAYQDAATNLLVNTKVAKGELTNFIRGANSLLANLTLGLDPLNATVNFVGSNILRGTELSQFTEAIKAGDTELAGALAKLSKVDITGQGDLVLAPAKLLAKAFKNYVSDFSGNKSLLQFYKDNGFYRDISDQFKSILADFTLTGTESLAELDSRLRRAYAVGNNLLQTGQKATGNKLAEEMNRFLSADVMRQLTDVGVAQGLLSSKEALSYINTFVNRVEGNVIASQRPFIFQGPIGQAVGLFQSYQFNLMQQMFRYVAEGTKKDAAMLLGLQGTFFGLQGLPAFQAINQHIVGTLSGNQNHIDAYDAIYGAAGKNLGDLLTYGIPSNLLQTNLYTRGDINPRQVTILPTALMDVPFIGAFTKLMTSIKTTAQKIGGGANVWESILQGLEHNGVSRPLAGIAQTLQATTGTGTPFSTTTKGSIIFSNDLVSLATLSRLAGGRPLDEAIINDGIFRIQAYQQYDRNKMMQLAETIKASSINGQDISSGQWTTFAARYAELGGKQINFNKFMMSEIKSANTNGAEKIINQLHNPLAQKAQLLMGGSFEFQP